MSLKLHRYLRRIRYGGPLSPTRTTLHNLHRAHLLAIPFENIDVQLGLVPPIEHDAIFEKIVLRERGGWCFEHNLLFAWVLRQIGLRVDVIGATVGRTKPVEGTPINHVALFVHLDEPYLADVGFGNGFLNPTPLQEGTFNDGRFDFKLTNHGKFWRFYNHRENGATYDFSGDNAGAETIEAANRSLATTSESPFVQTLVCAQLREDGMVTLTNAALRIFSPKQMNEESASSHESFTRILREYFALKIDRSEALWTRVADQHKRWLRKKIRGF
ncbi:MAG TPA: arylamine N-acetyltransferase [Candidatus Baltobacteraceae bacterium]|nr:arylamine N-acetyltransferase [Candidatus Baltobacteraceae bacterium]